MDILNNNSKSEINSKTIYETIYEILNKNDAACHDLFWLLNPIHNRHYPRPSLNIRIVYLRRPGHHSPQLILNLTLGPRV